MRFKLVSSGLLVVFLCCFLPFVVRAFSGPVPPKSTVNLESGAAVALLLLFCTNGSRVEGKPTSPAVSSDFLRGNTQALLALLLAAVPFLITIRAPFLFDSYTHVVTASKSSFGDALRTAYAHPTSGDFFFRPLGYLNYWFEYQWAGWSSTLWHVSNLFFHIAAVYLFYFVCRKLDLSAAGACMASLFFGLHGTNPEVVSWIAARFDELATCFVLLTLVFLVQYLEQGKWYGLMLVTCACALLSKEAAFCIPGLAACSLWYRGVWNTRAAKSLGGLIAVCAVVFAYRYWVIGEIGGYRDVAGRPTILHFSLVHFLELLFFRLWQVLVFPINWAVSLQLWLAAALVLFVMAAAVSGLVPRPKLRMMLAALAFAVSAILPASHLALLDASLGGSRVYHLSLIGMALFVGAVYEGFVNRKTGALVLSAFLVFQCAALIHNLLIWRSTASLAQHTCTSFGKTASKLGPVVLLPLPSMHNGVFFLANGFGNCVYVNSGQRPTILSASEGSGEPVFAWDEKSEAIKRIR